VAFDPDLFLAGGNSSTAIADPTEFDPDKFLSNTSSTEFDPDKFLGIKASRDGEAALGQPISPDFNEVIVPKQSFDTPLSGDQEAAFQGWKRKFAPNDSGEDYDLRGAFKAGVTSDPATGHWPDTFKKPNHPTFSDESQYAGSGAPGSWKGGKFSPAGEKSAADSLHENDPTKGERWNAEQLRLAKEAQAAGLPPASTGWDRLVDAIDRAHKGGYHFAHFAGTDYDPTGDRSVTIDMQNLSNVLRQKEDAERKAGNVGQADATAKERAYWEVQAGAGMSAEQWKAQTGQDDIPLPPNGPGGVSAEEWERWKKQADSDSGEGAIFDQAEQQAAMERGTLKPTPPENPIPFLEKPLFEFGHLPVTSEQSLPARFGSAVLNKVGEFVSGLTSFQGIIGLLPPVGAAQIVAQAPDLVERVKEAEKTPPGSPERINASLDVVLAIGSLGALGAGVKGVLKARPKATLKSFDQLPVDLTEQAIPKVVEPVQTTQKQAAAAGPVTRPPGVTEFEARDPAIAERLAAERATSPASEPGPAPAPELGAMPETPQGFEPAREAAAAKTFVPSTQWQEIPEGTVLPNGGEYRFDQASGKNFARWNQENLPADMPGRTEQPAPTSTKNAVTAAERESRGIAPAEEEAAREFGTVWKEAEKVAAEDPGAPERLVQSLNENPRALTDHENALLLRRQIEVQNEHDAAIKAVNERPGDLDALARLDDARNAAQAVYDAAKRSGAETARGLNARKMLASQDFTLSRMEAELRAARGGKPLTPELAAEVARLNKRIETLTSQLEAKEEFKTAIQTARRSRAKAFSPVEFLEKREAAAIERIKARRTRLYSDPLGIQSVAHLTDEAIIGAAHIARGLRNFKEWSTAMLKDFGDGIKPFLKALFAKSQSLHSEAARLSMAKSRTVEQTVKTLRKIGANDLTTEKLPPVRPDRELLELRANLQRAKDEFAKRVYRQRKANMSFGRKAADKFVRAERAMKLTGITTLGKLGSAGATRLVSSFVEEVVGSILGKLPIIRRIAAEAPREGRISLKAEIAAPTIGVARGVRNIPKILKGVRTTEEALYGKHNLHYEGGSWMDIPGRVHGAIKSPFKEAERVRSTMKRQAFETRKGGDPHDAATEQEIGEAANMDAQRAIFMQDNLLSDGYRALVGMMEHSRKFPTAGFVGAKIANFLLPIVKVPTNVALETITHLTGTVTASGKLATVMMRGLRTIKPAEADMIMRHYKKGMVGAALFLTGYFNADKLGGFYQKGEKRADSDVRWGSARIWGVEIPAWLLHAPAFLVLQAGATFARVMHQTHKGEEQGKIAGTLAVAEGLVHEIPFMNEMSRFDKMLMHNYEGTKARGDLLRSTLIPQGVQNVAGWMDNGVRHSPQTELDHLKMGIPGLRQQVPEKTQKSKRLGPPSLRAPSRPNALIQRKIGQVTPAELIRAANMNRIEQFLASQAA
jgi:hypothetical protein